MGIAVITVQDLLRGAIQQVIAMRPAAIRYCEEIEHGDRPAPSVDQLAAYIKDQFHAGRCRLATRIRQDTYTATLDDINAACRDYAVQIIEGLSY